MKTFLKAIVLVLGFIPCLTLSASDLSDEEYAQMTFVKKTHNFGVVARDTCVVTCTFTFTNTGNAPLIIHQAYSSCGCTVPEFTQEPVQPGKSGTIKVTYNGKTKRAGVFKKSITIHSNSKETPVYIYIEGEMIDEPNIEELVPTTETTEALTPADTLTVESQPAEKPRKGLFRRIFTRRQQSEAK